MRITDWLRAEHVEFRLVLRTIEVAQHDPGPTGSAKVRKILKRLLSDLRDHEAIEDMVLAPALKRKGLEFDAQLRAVFTAGHTRLHSKLDRLQEALALGTAPITQFVAAVDFGDLLRSHMDEEEKLLFPIVERVLSFEEQEALGQKAEERSSRRA